MPCHTLFCSAGADPEHRGGGEPKDGRGGVSVLQAGSLLPRWESKTTRDPAVPLHLLPRRAQEQQGPGSVSLLSLIDLWVVCLRSLICLWSDIHTDLCSSLPQYRLLGPSKCTLYHLIVLQLSFCVIPKSLFYGHPDRDVTVIISEIYS